MNKRAQKISTEKMTAPAPSNGSDASAFAFLGYMPGAARYETEKDFPLESNETIFRLIRPRAKVLDVGCGTGKISARLARDAKAKVTGIEPNAIRADLARSRGIKVHRFYLDESNVSGLGTFDYVLFADVLEHLSDPGRLLKLSRRLLVPNGKVVISVPNVAHWSVRCNLVFGRFNYDQFGIMDATHLRWFTQHSLRRFIKNCGFSVETISFTAGETLPVYERMKIIPHGLRTKIVRLLSQIFPNLFACQFVVVAAPLPQVRGCLHKPSCRASR